MGTLTENLETMIDQAERKLQFLRDEFDRLDANHPHQSVSIQKDIVDVTATLTRLSKLKNEIVGVPKPKAYDYGAIEMKVLHSLLQDAHDAMIIGPNSKDYDMTITKLQAALAKAKGQI